MTPIPEIIFNSLASLMRVLLGTGVAIFLGFSLGILRSQLPPFLKKNIFFNFFLDAIKYPPPIAWIPFVILAFGLSPMSPLIIVVIGAFAPIFTNSYEATEKIPNTLKQTLVAFEVRGWKKQKALLMSGLPQSFAGIKIGIGMGWMSVIAAEMLAGQSGLGYSIQAHRFNMQYSEMALDMTLIGTIGFGLSKLLSLLESRLFVWHESREK